MRIVILLSTLALGACGPSLAEMDSTDDTTCRQRLAQQGSQQPDAYAVCRQSLSGYRRDRAIRSTGN